MKVLSFLNLVAFVALMKGKSVSAQACEDVSEYRYKDHKCGWIRRNEDRRRNLCRQTEVQTNCPFTCGTCCENSKSYRLTTNKGEQKCWWIGKEEKRQKKFCEKFNNGSKVRLACPVACDFCPGTYCTNNPDYAYNDKEGKDCIWIQNQPENFCSQTDVVKNCPVTCGVCCEDDPKYVFDNNKTCEWLSEQGKRKIDRLCPQFKNKIKVKNACLKTCGTCPDKTLSPTDSPVSSSPTDSPVSSSPTIPETSNPTGSPSSNDTGSPTSFPTSGSPTDGPTVTATGSPTASPTTFPSSSSPTDGPTVTATGSPTASPTTFPSSSSPTDGPTVSATGSPTASPTNSPSTFPSSSSPTDGPTVTPNPTTPNPTSCDWTQLGSDIVGDAAGERAGPVALSSNGLIVAVGSYKADVGGTDIGSTRVFEFSNNAWGQLGDAIPGETAGDEAGSSVAISNNGQIVAVGSPKADSDTGQVRVWEWDSTTWNQKGGDIVSFKNRSFGTSVALASDGLTVVVGGPGDISGSRKGIAAVYAFVGSSWGRVYDTIVGVADELFGTSVAITSDATTIAVGAPGSTRGTVYVYENDSSAWSQLYVRSGDPGPGAAFGTSVGLRLNGGVYRLAVGDPGYGSNTGEATVSESTDGGLNWNVILGLSGLGSSLYGQAVDLSPDGSILASGAPGFNDGVLLLDNIDTGAYSVIENNQGMTGSEFGGYLSMADDLKVAVSAEKANSNTGFVRVFDARSPLSDSCAS